MQSDQRRAQRFSSRQHRSPTPKEAVEAGVVVAAAVLVAAEQVEAEQAVVQRVRAAQAARRQAQVRVRRETREAPPA